MKRMVVMWSLLATVGIVLVLSSCISTTSQKVPGKILGLENVLQVKPAISTNLSDAATEIPFLDDFDPKQPAPMTVLPRTPNGGFRLVHPGLFQLKAQSYCLHAGKYRPGGGDGYLYAPLEGPEAAIARKILQRSVSHPEIPQPGIQMLLWAVISRTKISDMSPGAQLTAAGLLTPEEILELNGGALGLIPQVLREELFAGLPPLVRQTLEAEAQLRELLTSARATYEDLERVAVLVGDPRPGKGSREVPRGRWSYHPNGFFVRYLPRSYSRTRIQFYVPEPFRIGRDERGRIRLIADRHGNRIEMDYDDTIEPATVSGDPGVRAYAFRSIRFVRPNPSKWPEMLTTEWNDVGWTLVGAPSGEGRVNTAPDRFPDLKERYESAKGHKTELDKFGEQFATLRDRRDRPDVPEGITDCIINLGHCATALNEATGGGLGGRAGGGADPIALVKRAWQSAVCVQARGNGEKGAALRPARRAGAGSESSPAGPMAFSFAGNPDAPPAPDPAGGENGDGNDEGYELDEIDLSPGYELDEIDLSGDTAVPGNTSRQRLGQSGRSSDPSDEALPDADGDGTPNFMDEDIDGDGQENWEDDDMDGDGKPNDQDPDIDGDGMENDLDFYPWGESTEPYEPIPPLVPGQSG